MQSETGFAHTSRAGQRQQAYFRPSQERSRARRIVLASNQRGKLYGKIMFWRWFRFPELLSYSACRWKGDDGGLENLQSMVSKHPLGSMSPALASISCSLKGFCGCVESFEGQFF